ncbi:hypothetical protein [Alteriqipengyuania lutimaris]|uniref:Uncharacterized protein n=1 Tax=Alteriqipengyuania lutimaris TaxID=1538146 RepID=A0A395LVC4_9SPHN|nr:hypothetical protein [Alteriqipengyuania lutimaris]MBB3032460.1 hypothetical protein [Alteriqipengyuania lutimaris]RDS78400.1 hypothetical protein DL238_12835 [Alteriqipengyuania lutimaris]
MSYDQKPSRIKLVSNGGTAHAPGNAPVDTRPLEQAIQDVVDNAQQQPATAPARRFSIMSVILFLLGSAIGGAGLVAWPHLAG